MRRNEKDESRIEQAKGKLKEAAGRVTGNERLRGEGRSERAKGSLRETKEDVKDSVKGTVQGMRGGGRGRRSHDPDEPSDS